LCYWEFSGYSDNLYGDIVYEIDEIVGFDVYLLKGKDKASAKLSNVV